MKKMKTRLALKVLNRFDALSSWEVVEYAEDTEDGKMYLINRVYTIQEFYPCDCRIERVRV